jgi:hypothetical protein
MQTFDLLPVLKKNCRLWLVALSVLLCTSWNPAKAQSGTYMYDAIPAGTLSSYGNPYFIDSRQLDYYYNYNSIGGYGPDMWYSFTVYDFTDLQIITCGSNFSTAVHVLDESGTEIAYSDYSGSCGYQGEVIQNFAPGNYFVVVEGSGYGSYTGYIQLMMYAVPPAVQPEGAKINNPVVAGTFGSCGGSYTDSRSNATSGMGNEYGQPSNDIYYQFTLTSVAAVILSHCGSGFDTYMWLLDASGNLITYNDDNSVATGCPGYQSYIQTTLAAGTYYVVSEGYGSGTGNIVTNINVAGNSVPAGANMVTAVDAGTFSASGSYTNTKSNTDPCLGNDYGQPTNDIYYKFVLTQSADVTLSHTAEVALIPTCGFWMPQGT